MNIRQLQPEDDVPDFVPAALIVARDTLGIAIIFRPRVVEALRALGFDVAAAWLMSTEGARLYFPALRRVMRLDQAEIAASARTAAVAEAEAWAEHQGEPS